jgi:hypothetical protein
MPKQAYEYGFQPENHDAISKEEYDTMHLYQMRKYWIRQQRIISFPDNPDNNLTIT